MTGEFSERVKKAAAVPVAAGAREVFLFGSAAAAGPQVVRHLEFCDRPHPSMK